MLWSLLLKKLDLEGKLLTGRIGGRSWSNGSFPSEFTLQTMLSEV